MTLNFAIQLFNHYSTYYRGWSGVAKGVLYLMSLGHPLDIGLHLGKACCPCSRYQVRVEGNVFISSVSSLSFLVLFLPCPSLSSPLLSFLSLFSLSLGEETEVDVSLNLNTNNQLNISEA